MANELVNIVEVLRWIFVVLTVRTVVGIFK